MGGHQLPQAPQELRRQGRGKPATAAKPTPAQPASFADHTSQTAVVPKGGVAAGAETTNNTGDHTP
ncbi:hypothetical protein AB0451_36685 [Streptomyces sp. NPDC052000]|uniref:hypothetical protein n=1 Tax=Streptomyces sp. NPDC052000 TaxID=3155676 RepID=UPI00344B8D1A